MIVKPFNLRLKDIRKSKRITQEELGYRIGSHQSAIWSYESGRTTPQFDTLVRIIQALDCQANDLIPAK